MTDHLSSERTPAKDKSSPNSTRPITLSTLHSACEDLNRNQDALNASPDVASSTVSGGLNQHTATTTAESKTDGADGEDRESDDSGYGTHISECDIVARLAASALARVAASIQQSDLLEQEQAQLHLEEDLPGQGEGKLNESAGQPQEIESLRPTEHHNQDQEQDQETHLTEDALMDRRITEVTDLLADQQEDVKMSVIYPEPADIAYRTQAPSENKDQPSSRAVENESERLEPIDRSIPFEDPGLCHIRDVFFCYAFMNRFFELLKKSCSTIPVKMYKFETLEAALLTRKTSRSWDSINCAIINLILEEDDDMHHASLTSYLQYLKQMQLDLRSTHEYALTYDNPFELVKDYYDVPPLTRVQLLSTLVELAMEKSLSVRQQIDTWESEKQSSSLREAPVGVDRYGRTFWMCGKRSMMIFRETKYTGSWECVTRSMRDVKRLVRYFTKTNNVFERIFRRWLIENVLRPEKELIIKEQQTKAYKLQLAKRHEEEQERKRQQRKEARQTTQTTLVFEELSKAGIKGHVNPSTQELEPYIELSRDGVIKKTIEEKHNHQQQTIDRGVHNGFGADADSKSGVDTMEDLLNSDYDDPDVEDEIRRFVAQQATNSILKHDPSNENDVIGACKKKRLNGENRGPDEVINGKLLNREYDIYIDEDENIVDALGKKLRPEYLNHCFDGRVSAVVIPTRSEKEALLLSMVTYMPCKAKHSMEVRRTSQSPSIFPANQTHDITRDPKRRGKEERIDPRASYPINGWVSAVEIPIRRKASVATPKQQIQRILTSTPTTCRKDDVPQTSIPIVRSQPPLSSKSSCVVSPSTNLIAISTAETCASATTVSLAGTENLSTIGVSSVNVIQLTSRSTIQPQTSTPAISAPVFDTSMQTDWKKRRLQSLERQREMSLLRGQWHRSCDFLDFK
ncbi:hypothetical protein BGZ83_004652 [Gryganskiella cystojenkinii]|nr:hypothetical protein BGZ83_004652 [Gryganskiella cystojenkinii]